MVKFSLNAGKERLHLPTEVCGCAKAIMVVGQEIDGDWGMAHERESVAHPTIACAKIKDAQRPISQYA